MFKMATCESTSDGDIFILASGAQKGRGYGNEATVFDLCCSLANGSDYLVFISRQLARFLFNFGEKSLRAGRLR